MQPRRFVSYTLDPAAPDGDNGWYVSPVTVDWTVDGRWRETAVEGCVDETITDEGDPITRDCDASSVLGTDSMTASFRRDATPPTVEVTGVSDGAVYVLGTEPTPDCSTSDRYVGRRAGCCAVGDRWSDSRLLRRRMLRRPGQCRQHGVGQRDLPGRLRLRRLRPARQAETNAKAGSAVPIKFSLGGDHGLAVLAGTPMFQQTNCTTGAPIGSPTPTAQAEPFSLEADGQYKYVWKTLKSQAGMCGTVTFAFIDGTSHSAAYTFK